MLYYASDDVQDKVGKAQLYSDVVESIFVTRSGSGDSGGRIRAKFFKKVMDNPEWRPSEWMDFRLLENETKEEWMLRYMAYEARRRTGFTSFPYILNYARNWGNEVGVDRNFVYLENDFTEHGFVAHVFLPGGTSNEKQKVTPQMAEIMHNCMNIGAKHAMHNWHRGISLLLVYSGPRPGNFGTYEMPKYWGWSSHS